MRKGIKMIAGIPGTGIGGLFYLIIALWMPIRELYCKVFKRSSLERWHIVRRHIFITLWLIMGMWATGELLGLLLLHLGMNGSHRSHNFLHVRPFLLTLATLTFVYLAVHAIRFYISDIDKKAKDAAS